VVYDRGAAMPWDIVDAATAYGDVVFLCDGRSAHARDLLPLMRELAETHVVDTAKEAVDRLTATPVCGVVTFSDSTLLLASGVAAHFDCRFHTADVALALTDKRRQRELLSAGGLPVPDLRVLDEPRALADAAAAIGFPCIVKARRSSEGRNSHRVDDAAGAEALATALDGSWAEAGGFLVEQLFVGDQAVAGPAWGDYVSVESLVLDGRVAHVAVLGKFPLLPPFRETGQFLPSTLAPAAEESARTVARKAIAALGIRHGTCHTELKLTDDGPRIIEVNGRLGGAVTPLLKASCGVSLLEMTIAAAVGAHDDLTELLEQADRVNALSYQIKCYAPSTEHGVHHVSRVLGLDRTHRMRGVTAAYPTKRRGDRIHPALGSAGDIAHVYGVTGDHTELAGVFKEVCATVVAEFAPR
jgi:formate-dependent phosphoribosylglycinamide formyltransferase (GAR transformylase)